MDSVCCRYAFMHTQFVYIRMWRVVPLQGVPSCWVRVEELFHSGKGTKFSLFQHKGRFLHQSLHLGRFELLISTFGSWFSVLFLPTLLFRISLFNLLSLLDHVFLSIYWPYRPISTMETNLFVLSTGRMQFIEVLYFQIVLKAQYL
jgi:hypothetical protein